MAETDDLLSIDEATLRIDAAIAPLSDEEIAPVLSLGRRLARDVLADHPVPDVARAACDGFAIRAEETFGAGSYSPLRLRLDPAVAVAGAGWTVPCREGDPLPDGADAVVPLEDAEIAGPGIELVDALAPGDHVVPAGGHARPGSVLIGCGRRIDPDHVGLLIAVGCDRVTVFRQPRVSILTTRSGAAGSGADKALLEALVTRDGGIPVNGLAIERDADDIAQALSDTDADLCIVTSGSHVQPEDAALAGLVAAGSVTFHGVALAPGMATGFGRTARGLPVFVVPAAAEHCLWAYEFLAGRGVRRLGGSSGEADFVKRRVSTATKIVSAIGMSEVHPIELTPDGSARPLPAFTEAGLASAARADGFALVPEGSEGVAPGGSIEVHLRPGACAAAPQVDGRRSAR